MIRKSTLLIEDNSHASWPRTFSNWDIDNRGADGNPWHRGNDVPQRHILSVLDDAPTVLKRDVTEQIDGTVTFECVYSIIDGDGFYFAFLSEKDTFLKLTFKNKALYLDEQKLTNLDYGRHYIKFVIDIDNKSFRLISDKTYVGKFPANGNGDSISAFSCGFSEKDKGYATLFDCVKMYKDYIIYDYNLCLDEGALPYEYDVETNGNAKAQNARFGEKYFDYSYKLSAKAGGKVTVSRKLDAAKENFALSIKYLLRDTDGKINIGLYGNDKAIVSIEDNATALEHNGLMLKNHSFDVWQTLDFEVSFDTKDVLVKLNGKKVKNLSFENDIDVFDCLKVGFTSSADSISYIGEIFACPMIDEPCDYVPEPVIPKKKGDYYVGMNVCPLWKSGEHMGWDCITPFDEIKPLMGYYDEGIAETADWEIKFLAEHGIDFELFCWYASESNTPMRETPLSAAIHGGYFNAKYSDKCKFALLWEAANAKHPQGSDAFRKILVPYWVDYFFTDERYMTIDNKAIMSIFGIDWLESFFGTKEKAAEELEYLREVVRNLGYDDLVILGCSDAKEEFVPLGLDGAHAYNWGFLGNDVNETKKMIKNNSDKNLYHIVPTVSTGFNNVGWGGDRTPNISVDGMEECLNWCKDEMLTRYDKDTWQSKLIMLSNWNEYGEGTYICPTGLNGFGYLDAVRRVFCEDNDHIDHVPTDNQKSRICHLYPQDRASLAKLHREKPKLSYDDYALKLTFNSEEDLKDWSVVGFSDYKIKDGRLVGHSETFDPYMIYKGEIPFTAEEISHVVVNIRGYKPINQICCTEMFFSNRDDKELNLGQYTVLTVPECISPLEYKLYNKPEWKCKISAFRLDPIYAVGDFELESVTFYKYPKNNVKVVLDGEILTMRDFVTEENGECHFAFDPECNLANVKELYYEWNRNNNSLTLYGKHTVKLFVGKNYMIFDGKKMPLSKEISLFDGLPVIPMSVYCKALGYSMIRDGKCISVKRA